MDSHADDDPLKMAGHKAGRVEGRRGTYQEYCLSARIAIFLGLNQQDSSAAKGACSMPGSHMMEEESQLISDHYTGPPNPNK